MPDSKGFRRTEAGLAAAAFLAPFSATHLVGPLTVGRAAVLALAATLTIDAIQEWAGRPRANRPFLLLLGGYAGLWLWAALSSVVWGCNCDGKLGGFTEFVAIGLLAAIAIALCPRLRGVAIVAFLGGLLLAALLALAGVGSINSGTVDLTQTGGRLSGTYGNANELGFAAALGVPIALGFRSLGSGRNGLLLLLGILAVLGTTIVLTFSRGAVITVAAGVLAVLLLEARGSRRRIGLTLAGAGACAVAAVALYAVFETERKDVSFESVSPALRGLDQRDLSGWDSRALGPIPSGPSSPYNGDGAIAVRSGRAHEGISYRWGEAASGGTYVVRLRARSPQGHVRLRYALGDADRAERALETVVVGPAWRQLSLSWQPRSRSPHATFYAWRQGGAPTFEIGAVGISGGRVPGAIHLALPGRLEGSAYDRMRSEADRSERRYIESRVDAARLAFDAFKADPVQGIGWSSFPDYAAAHLHFGQLATHDQYLAVAAELGAIGLLLFALFAAAIVAGCREVERGPAEIAAIGLLAAAGAGMVFVEALPTPQLSIPIALAAAVVCAQGRRAPT